MYEYSLTFVHCQLCILLLIKCMFLGHPTHMSANLCYITDSSFFFLLSSSIFFFRRLIIELGERNSTTMGHMIGSKCNLKTHAQNLGYPLPPQIGGLKPPFWTISQLHGKFNSLYLQNKTWYRQSGKRVDNYKGSPISSQTTWILVHKRL